MTEPSDTPPLARLDAVVGNLRRAERRIAAMAAALAEAREALAASPGDPEAARRVSMAELRMRADAAGLAESFAALAQPDGAAP